MKVFFDKPHVTFSRKFVPSEKKAALVFFNELANVFPGNKQVVSYPQSFAYLLLREGYKLEYFMEEVAGGVPVAICTYNHRRHYGSVVIELIIASGSSMLCNDSLLRQVQELFLKPLFKLDDSRKRAEAIYRLAESSLLSRPAAASGDSNIFFKKVQDPLHMYTELRELLTPFRSLLELVTLPQSPEKYSRDHMCTALKQHDKIVEFNKTSHIDYFVFSWGGNEPQVMVGNIYINSPRGDANSYYVFVLIGKGKHSGGIKQHLARQCYGAPDAHAAVAAHLI